MNSKPASTDLINQTIAGFTILHRLGVGGMSEVYLAFQESLHRHVALKVLRSDFVGSPDHEQRFLQEARAVATLIHPNIVQIFDVGKFESVHYIAQEYVPGSNLHAYIQRRGALPLRESVSILWQSTAALQKAGSIGLVHRDIKPDNLLLTPEGEVKVADFGLARARGQAQNLTAAGVTLGTPLYMSPEQIQGLEVDSRSDLYSLGATAYHMLSGRPPFSGDTALALAIQHLQKQPEPLERLRPDLPKSLVELVHKLLSKKPDDRYASASDLNQALREVVDQHLQGRIDQMTPFSGLVIDNHRVSNLEVTQKLQQLTKASLAKYAQRNSWIKKGVAAVVVIAIGTLFGMSLLNYDPLPVLPVGVEDVPRESNIQRQFGLALSVNDLRHWRAVSAYFEPSDATSINYALKAELQIARLCIKSDNFQAASQSLRKVLDSAKADEVLLNIARIELGFVMNKIAGPSASESYYEAAQRSLRQMKSPEKKLLIQDALPERVRDWFRNQDLEKSEPHDT